MCADLSKHLIVRKSERAKPVGKLPTLALARNYGAITTGSVWLGVFK
jgi:hypothetical protein